MAGISFKSSIFLKLTLIVILFGVLFNLSLFYGLRSASDLEPRRDFPRMLRSVERNVMREVGDPPDTSVARRVCYESEVDMRYVSDSLKWSSNPEVPTLVELMNDPEFQIRFKEDNRFPFPYKGKFLSVHRTPNGVFILLPLGSNFTFLPQKAIIILLLLMSVLLISLYFIIRKLFSPVKMLTGAVRQIGEGNYNVNLPHKSKDELGELASSINVMSSKIKSQIKSKEQLLLDVSHELRSPLTRIKLGLEVDSPKDKINEDVMEMEKMINDLLEAYKTESSMDKLNIVETDLTKLVKDVINEYGDDKRLKFISSRESINIKADTEKMRTVFRNLIDNSLKYSSDTINIEITDRIDKAEIKVKDRGIGISDEDLKNIFEPFYRADRSRSRDTGGFGLGLSICKRIIEAHRGSISIVSRLSEGTEATILLPK